MGFNPVPKPQHRRRVPKQRNRTRITNKVRKEVLRRSEGKCERCGRSRSHSFEMAHLQQASQGGWGNDPANIVLLCGPSVNTGACNNFADYTDEGSAWSTEYRGELIRN